MLSVLSAFCVPVYPVTTSKADKYSGLLTLAISARAPQGAAEYAEAHLAAEMSHYDGHTFHSQRCHRSKPLYHPHETTLTPQLRGQASSPLMRQVLKVNIGCAKKEW